VADASVEGKWSIDGVVTNLSGVAMSQAVSFTSQTCRIRARFLTTHRLASFACLDFLQGFFGNTGFGLGAKVFSFSLTHLVSFRVDPPQKPALFINKALAPFGGTTSLLRNPGAWWLKEDAETMAQLKTLQSNGHWENLWQKVAV
jgi:hypothetical protein